MNELLIVGAGPAGISMAVEAIELGIPADKILIVEKAREHSFTIKKFYHDKKLVTANYKGFSAVCKGVMCLPDSTKDETISFLDRAIARFNIRVKYNENVSKIHHNNSSETFEIQTNTNTYQAKTVAIAVGVLGRPNKPDYPIPNGLKQNILFDITTRKIENSRVLLVGGGDSVSEYCQYLSDDEFNNQLFLSYRQDSFSRMNLINKVSIEALADSGKVDLILNSNIQSIDQVGAKAWVHFVEDDIPALEADVILYALGGSSPANFLKSLGIEFDGPKPRLKNGYETNIRGLFLIGDLTAHEKGGSLIWAFNSANIAMKAICEKYLNCQHKV